MEALPIYFLKGTTQGDENEVRPKAYTFWGNSLRNSMQKHMYPLHKEMTLRTHLPPSQECEGKFYPSCKSPHSEQKQNSRVI